MPLSGRVLGGHRAKGLQYVSDDGQRLVKSVEFVAWEVVLSAEVDTKYPSAALPVIGRHGSV